MGDVDIGLNIRIEKSRKDRTPEEIASFNQLMAMRGGAPKVCMNMHRLTSEQMPGLIRQHEWEWLNAVSLKNPVSSSA